MDTFFIIVLILSTIGLIYFSWKALVTRKWKHILGLILSLIPLLSTAIFLWLIFTPYRQIHADDKKYFGEYVFKEIEGKFEYGNINQQELKLFLKSDFTYELSNFNERQFPLSGKWQTCWSDDCQIGFNFDKTNYFLALDVIDSSGRYLKLHKPKHSTGYLVFKKKH